MAKQLELSINTSSVLNQLKKVQTELKNIQTQVDTINKTKLDFGGNQSTQQTAKINTNIKQIERTARAASNSVFTLGKQFGTAFDTTSVSNNITSMIQRSVSGFSQLATSAKNGFNQINDGASAVVNNLGKISVAILGVSKSISNVYNQTSANRQRFIGLFDGPKSELKQAQKDIESISNSYGVAQETLYGAAYQYLSGGGSSNANAINEFIRNIGLTTRTSVLNTAETEDFSKSLMGMANSLSSQNKGTSSIDYIGVLANYQKYMEHNSYMSAQDFSKVASNWSKVQGSGMSPVEYLAAMTTLTATGKNASEATTLLSNFSMKTMKQSAKSGEISKALGVNISNDILEKNGLVAYLKEIKNKMKESTGKDVTYNGLAQLFTNIRAGDAIASMIANVDILEKNIKGLNESAGMLQEDFEKVMESPEGKWETASQNMQNSIKKLGAACLPAFANMANSISGVIDKFTAFAEQNPQTVETLLRVATIGAVATTSLFLLKSTVGLVTGAFKMFSGVGQILGGVANSIATFTGLSLTQLGLLTGGILGIVYVMWFAKENFGSVCKGIAAIFVNALGIILKVVELAVRTFDVFCNQFNNGFNKMTENAPTFVKRIGSTFSTVTKMIMQFINPINGLISAFNKLFGMNISPASIADNLSVYSDKMIDWADDQQNTTTTTKNGYFIPKNAESSANIKDIHYIIKGKKYKSLDDFYKENPGQTIDVSKDVQTVVTTKDKLKVNPFEDIKNKLKDLYNIDVSNTDANNYQDELKKLASESQNTINDILNNSQGLNKGDTVTPILNALNNKQEKENQALKEKEQLLDEISSKYKQIQDNILGSASAFDKFKRRFVNSNSLLNNVKRQAEAMQELAKVKESLMNSSVLPDSFKSEIAGMGIDKLAELRALNSMSSKDLKAYGSAQSKINGLAKEQANANTINVYVNEKKVDNTASKIANEIYNELRKKGFKFN